jgi:putative oxidoreductase
MIRNFVIFAGRVLMSAVFLLNAYLIFRAPEQTAAFLERFNVPGTFAPAVSLALFVGSAMILFGIWTRLVAFIFAVFTIAWVGTFYPNISTDADFARVAKDLAIAGGFLVLAMAGAGGWALTGRRI